MPTDSQELEYTSAQDMLKHYDSLNWQIGSILVAATVVLTGLVLNDDALALLRGTTRASQIVAFGVPAFSLFILSIWFLWFRRHRALYNFRNETLHRLELNLGMYHFLRVVEADLSDGFDAESKTDVLHTAKLKAGHDSTSFTPFYRLEKLPGPSGYVLAMLLAFGIPALQLILLLAIKYS